MPSTVSVAVHPSQFPGSIRRELIQRLRQRRIPPKFHYQSYKQSQKWLVLHDAWSPSRTDPDCGAVYDRSFAAAGGLVAERRVRVIGLGCGGGQKEARLLVLLAEQGRELSYTPCDVSLALVLTATEEATRAVEAARCSPLLCDLAVADDLPAVLDRLEEREAPRVITFFGMIPNFEPENIAPRLAALVRPGDVLLVSANLAPGPDYAAGVRRILPGYDNAETRDWLLTFLFDLGIEPGDGTLQIHIEEAQALKRIAADFHFLRDRALRIYDEGVEFRAGESLRLFFSYRYTPEKSERLLSSHRLKLEGQWITKSGEEGVFACRLC
ncbi:MAG TPA: L-histidine N(alpha)-methyltransferase [Candidatus Saccharimonadales bacterium]|nr:L-histidine N(alpha)-methyltransferase [Candidatus Saccharimonadales bacterium]